MPIKDDSDRHNLYLQKLAAGIYNSQVYPSLEEARKAVRMILLDAEEIKSVKELVRIQDKVEKEIDAIYGAGWSSASTELTAVAMYEASWQVDAINQYSRNRLTVPPKKQIQGYIDSAIMSLSSGRRVNSGVWSDFVDANLNSAKSQVNGLIVRGYQDGQTVGQINRAIKQGVDGVLAQEAETLARTGMAHYANAARDAMAAANDDIIIGRVFSATFDNRTTLICRGLDGKFYEKGRPYPQIPVHYGCRSSYYFVTDKSEIGQGKKSAVGGKGDGEDINPNRRLRYRGKKDKDIFKPGQINASTSQDAWLRNQPRWFVESALGDTRAKLFLDGKMSIDKFTDMQGRTITLNQLRELDANAFKRAGL